MSTILIAEDNEKNAKLVRDLLQVKGYATLETVTGQGCIDLARTHRPDLVLMDIQLPDISGIEAFRRLRSDPLTATIPVAAFTASVTVGDRRRIDECGFDAFISKPIQIREFLATVERVLRGGAR